MATSFHVHPDHGHPWDNRTGFDLLEFESDSQHEAEQFVSAAKCKFWQPWIIGTNDNSGKPGGVLYKPSGAIAPWNDSPNKPHPGNIMQRR
jgi:hypothetical protein